MTQMTDAAKQQLWDDYYDRRPARVPVQLGVNPRVIVLDPALNPEGYTFEQMHHDPKVHVEISLRHALHVRTVLNHYTDSPTELPDVWEISLDTQNVSEAALLGSPVTYPAGQVPSAEPWLDDANKEAVFDIPIDRPLAMPYLKDRMAFWRDMTEVCQGMTFEGRPVKVADFVFGGTDGPVTIGCCLRGDGFLMDLAIDPDYADRLMARVVDLALNRRDAMLAHFNMPSPLHNGMADDSGAMLSTEMYREQVMPHHRRFIDQVTAGREDASNGFHMCGNAGHILPTVCRELNVLGLDTGYPLDHGKLRREVGPDITIYGGPEVATLQSGTPDQVYQRATSILKSGVMQGKRFILREGNNLPPATPLDNLAAMYQAAQDHGRYDD